MPAHTFLAHIANDGREQQLKEHLTGTAALAADFARPFGGEAQAEFAGLAHDIGKYSDAFQRRLKGGPRVDHSTAGATECCKRGQLFAAFAVAGHHGGLPDGGTRTDSAEAPTLRGRIKRNLEPYSAWADEVTLPKEVPYPTFATKSNAAGMFFTRMLYSCLVDADFLDTEAFMSGKAREPAGGASVDGLWQRLRGYISGWFPPKNPLNEQRCAILERCMAEGEQRAPGLFTLTVPTGGGKTVASLAFALAHARTHGLRRIIYVIPYTSIIEQTAETFRNILGPENVLEHHSNVLYDLTGETSAETLRLAQATENWDVPVVVTTAVQFFESLYACRPSQCRKLHSMAGSVVIFDEAQMLPLSYLRPCVHAIAQLVENYRVSAVLCTATQPALNSVFAEFLPGILPVDLCPEGIISEEIFRRVTFRRAGKLSWDELAEQLNRQEQVLCVVNARKSAQEVFSRLEGEGCFHLSTLMYPAHRQTKLAEIRERLAGGLPCRVVSTSLIEAGVDVDFPAVWREEAGLDSILQAAGRCNREGKRSADESIVTVFRGEGNMPSAFKTAIGVERDIMEQWDDISSRQAVHAYFRELLELKGQDAQDAKKIWDLIQSPRLPFREIAERFHLIDSAARTIYIPRDKGAELTERLRAGERSRELFRKLGRYGVSVYENHFQALAQAGDLDVLEDGESAILVNLSLYNSDTGLSLAAEEGKAIFL